MLPVHLWLSTMKYIPNFACLNLKRILFREKRQIIKLNSANISTTRYCCLIEETGTKIDQSLTISSWKLSLNSGEKTEGLLLAGSTLLTKYSLDILQFCKYCVITNTSFNYTACLNCKKNCTHINQQYLSRIFNLLKRTSDWKLQPFHGNTLIVSFL